MIEILRHGASGELYAVSYADGMTFATLNGLAGPLTRAEAFDAVRLGADLGTEDLDWARTQPWSCVPVHTFFDLAEGE